MPKKTETLEEFIKNYISNTAASSSRKSYADWLRSNGIDSARSYSEKILDIGASYPKKASTYGSVAEKLASMGLTGGGYSDYINSAAYANMQSDTASAEREYAVSQEKNFKGYLEYLENYNAANKKNVDSVIKAIERADITDYDTAYKYALEAGLSEQNAKNAAQTASSAVRAQIKKEVVKTILKRSLTQVQAKEYALGLGLSEEDAQELAEYAHKINETVSSSDYPQGSYLDGLKKKAEGTTQK